ncbi:MAG: hypothetical protein V1678_01490 [Candidatus Aenigmatarchaeota archaeon]
MMSKLMESESLDFLPGMEEIRKGARESVPEEYRKIIRGLYDNPAELSICMSLYKTNINQPFGNDKVRKIVRRIKGAKLKEIPYILEAMKEKDLITVEDKDGKPDYFLTPKSATAMDTIDILEKKFVGPLLKEFKRHPELGKYSKHINKTGARLIAYAALTD